MVDKQLRKLEKLVSKASSYFLYENINKRSTKAMRKTVEGVIREYLLKIPQYKLIKISSSMSREDKKLGQMTVTMDIVKVHPEGK
jgi:hypothetical protein